MIRALIRTLFAAVTLFLLAAFILAWMTLEFGSRPESSFATPIDDPAVKYVDANGIRFGYLEEGEGPLVLLFHGYPETARSWSNVQSRLANEGYRVVAPFLRGYPPSSFAADGDYSVSALGQDVVALIDALGEESAIIVGHDWGASAVYRAAMLHPEKVDALVALAIPHPVAIANDPSVLLGASHFIYYQLPIAKRLVWSYDFAHMEWIYKYWSPTYDPPQEEIDDIKETLRVPGAIDGALGYYWSFFDGNDEGPDPATKISVPSLVIAGSADGTLDVDRFDIGVVGFSGAYRLKKLEGVGHFPQLEAPDAVADEIIEHLRALQTN